MVIFGRWALSWKARLADAINHLLDRFDIQVIRGDDIWRPLSQLGKQPVTRGRTEASSTPLLKGFQGSKITSLQEPADFAVVIPTIVRPTIADAIQSVFDQRFDGSVQILIGIDACNGDVSVVEQICRVVPDRHSVLLFYPGYSTSRRHGGLDASWVAGSLRTILSYLANSRYVATLDDDNWWSNDHVSSMHATLSAGAEWAWSLRWYVHPSSRQPICHDEWESVGPGKGYFSGWGGWVDPNCLAIDKIACEAVLRWWSIPLRNSPGAMDSDRNVFRILRTQFRGAPTGRHSVFYKISETDRFMHPYRLSVIGEQRYHSCAFKRAGNG
jgi:hypothetical protein